MKTETKLSPMRAQRALKLWSKGLDTAEIAWQMVVSEAKVYNALAEMRETKKGKHQ